MSKNNQITEEQLQKLQGFVSTLNQSQVQLGQLEVQKHGLLHQMAEVQKGLNEYQVELEDQYGKVSVNIQDGTYTPIVEEDESNKED